MQYIHSYNLRLALTVLLEEKNLSDFHSVLLEKPWRALLSPRDRARRAILRVSDYDHSIWYFRLIFIVLQNKYLIKQTFHHLLYCSIKDSTSNTMPKIDGMPFIIFCNQLIWFHLTFVFSFSTNSIDSNQTN